MSAAPIPKTPVTRLPKAQYDPATFLIVDDDKVSVRAIRRAIESLRYANPVEVAGDGLEALEYLEGAIDPDSGVLPPHIVLLDLSMPRLDGHGFLERIRNNPALARLVVFVVTTSDAPKDVMEAYDRNIAGYLVKDDPLESLREGIELIGAYSRLVVLP